MKNSHRTNSFFIPHSSFFILLVWLLALALSTVGFTTGRAVYERGAAYGDPGPAIPDLDGPARAINVQLELEPDDEARQRSLRLIKEAGFGWVRQQFQWAEVERGGKGVFLDTLRGESTWASYDRMVALARAEGLRVIARIDRTPAWARPPGTPATEPPADVRDYGDFVAAFVDHYRGQVDHVQLWNEPNLNNEWGDRTVDPAGYVALLKAGYQGVKRADPSVRVMSAELAQTLEPDAPSARGLDDLLYLDRMYQYGAQPFFDILAANAYGLWTGPADRQVGREYTNFPRVLLVRDVMRRHDDTGKAMWVTEFGWNALPAGWQGDASPWGQVSLQEQARYITGAYHRAQREWPWMGPMALWLFHQPGANPRDPTPYFGLVDAGWQPRPAYEALRQSGAPVLGPGIHQETSASIDFGGTWQWTPDATASLGAMRETPVSGATVRLRFEGTRIDLIAPAGPGRGIAYARLNGAYTLANRLPLNQFGQATIDLAAAQLEPQRRITIADGLPDRVHELELTVTGEHSDKSSGPGVAIDAFAVSISRPVAPTVYLGAGWGAALMALVWGVRRRVIALLEWLLARTALAARYAAGPVRILWIRAVTLALVTALPLAPLALRTPAGRYSPVELLALALLGVAALRLYVTGHLVGWRGAFAGPAGLLVAAGLISLLVADYPRLGLRELRTLVLEPAAFYFIARSALRDVRGAEWLARALVAGAVVAALLAIGQTLTGHGLVAAEGVERAAALYPSPNNLALFLDRALPLAVALALWRRTPGYVAAAALTIIAQGFTFSKGAWLATAVGLVALAIPYARRHPRLRERRTWVGLAAAGAVVLVSVTALALRVERFRSSVTGVLRVYLWRASLDMIRDHPIWGVGLDQFLYHYPRYMLPEAWREPNLSHPHNALLDFWLRLGLLGVATLCWAIWIFWRRARHAPAGLTLPGLRYGAIAAGLAMLTHGLVDNSYFVLDLAYATWAVLLILDLATSSPLPAGGAERARVYPVDSVGPWRH